MNVFASLLIVAAVGGAPIDARYPGAVTVFQSDFEHDADLDFDGWPNGWVRRRGSRYPHYLKLGLSHEPSARGRQCFRFNLDGGAACVSSPPVDYDRGAEYLVDASIKTVGLRHDEAYVALLFLNASGQAVQTELSRRLQSDEWRPIRIGPVFCDHPDVRQIVVELHLEPSDGRDLRGAALFDDVWIGKLPRKTVRGSRPYNVFQVNEPIELGVTLTGVTIPEIHATLELFDRRGASLGVEERRSSLRPSEAAAAAPRTMTWTPALIEPGYYRGKVVVYGPDGVLREDETSLVIVEPIERLRSGTGSFLGDFGWSISETDDVPNAEELHALLPEAGVRRLKYPVWFAAADSPEARHVMRIVERLNVQGIAVIGTLMPRPADPDGREPATGVAAALTFRDAPSRWMPVVEPTLFDLAFKVRGWQLGNDRDLGFLALPGAPERIAAVKREFDRIEQDSQLGIPWSWLQELPPAGRDTLRFLSLSSSPELTAHELGAMLDGANLPEGVQPWVCLTALSRHEYSTADRVRDLVERMAAAKIHGAKAVFYVDPFSSEAGLMSPGGSPSELFLPWRAVATVLDGAEPAGAVRLPGESDNRVFLRTGDAVMIVMRDEPGTETVDLSGAPRVTDLWERNLEVQATSQGAAFDVGPVPVIVTGLHRESTAWELAFRAEPPQLSEVFGTPQTLKLIVRNTFDRPVQGKITVVAPPEWTLRPAMFDVSLGYKEVIELPVEVTLPPGGDTHDALLRIEHDIAADRRRQFAVYRSIRIGDGEVRLEVDCRIVDNTVEIEQRLINNSSRSVSFRFNLFAPNQRRMRTVVNDLPPGIDVQRYRLPDAHLLKGKTLWIRGEEIGGNRLLSERFTVGDDP